MIRSIGTALLLVCVACGRLGFGTSTSAADAAGGADSEASDTGDSMVMAACEPAWLAGPSVTPPTRIASLVAPGTDYTPFLTADGLELYFASDRDGDFDIYSA